MEVYLLSVALSRHRLILPQPRANPPRTDTLTAAQHACDVPRLATAPVTAPMNAATLQRSPH